MPVGRKGFPIPLDPMAELASLLDLVQQERKLRTIA
jgi:hypothetical protein